MTPMKNRTEVKQRLTELRETLMGVDEGPEVIGEVFGSPSLVASSGRGTIPGGHVAAMAARQGRAQPSPEYSGNPPRRAGIGPASAVVIASAAAGGIAAGQVLSSSDELAEVMSETLIQMQRDPKNFGRKRKVASARWSYPEDRQLGDSASTNTKRIEQVCGLRAGRYDRRTGALTASGGICLPLAADFSVPTWLTADRPLRDGLPQFQATRGGVQYMTPPDVGVPDLQGTASGAGLATRVWSEATDLAPSGQVKPVWTVSCGTPETVYVNAVPTRIQFGNMQARFSSEMLAANTDVAIGTAAREAELELLTLMHQSANQVTPEKFLGATRDLLASADLLAQQYRYSHRIGDNTSLTAVFPSWARGVIRADLSRELAHDNSGGVNVLAITDAQIDDWFAVRGINVIWTLDGLKAGTYGTGGSALPNQYFALATAGAEPQWPNQASDGSFVIGWLLYAEGSFQFLDGGRLDLGVVRDSVLDSTNDFEVFVETFESVAFRGVEAYEVQSTVAPTGASAATSASTYHE
jgi:hypothetical protein